jgi:putative acetyltransferase
VSAERVIDIRDEQASDVAAIRDINRRAFGQEQEANIVDALRANGASLLSLVASEDGQVVGHVMFSPIDVNGIVGAALAPLAVVPERQRRGIGARLVEAGCERLSRGGCPFIIVLGHATYYPRFGFRPASRFGISCEWEVSDEVFMMLVLDETRMAGVAGVAKYRSEFSTTPA